METPHRYELREAEEERREELAEKKRRFLPPPRATPRTADEILAEAREACSDLGEVVGYLARQIEILERM